jgi:hypothetical protein
MNFESNVDLQRHGAAIGQQIMAQVGRWQATSPRTLQSTMRVLGMSELGGCREYVRASVSGDPKDPQRELKWPAFIGTAVGDFMERALVERAEAGWETQVKLTLTLPNGMSVSGSTDVYNRKYVVDFKTKDGTAEVKRDGPKLKEVIQISGYLIALVDAGGVDDDAVGVLVYIDRSGKDSQSHTFTVSIADARRHLLRAVERLDEVADAMATGVSQSYLRDEPESWCWYIQCPFYTACWTGYQPADEITHPELVSAIEMYAEGRRLRKQADNLMDTAKAKLYVDYDHKVEGLVAGGPAKGGMSLKWTDREYAGGELRPSIDLREARK